MTSVNNNDNAKLIIEPTGSDDFFSSSEELELVHSQTDSDKIIIKDDEIVNLPGSAKHMECRCPKCTEITSVELALIPESGIVIFCSSCNEKINIIRESCACRAKRKSFEINCANCGSLLDRQAHCHSCGKLFPDYFVAVNPDDVRKKARKKFFYSMWSAVKDYEFSIKPSFSKDIEQKYTSSSRSAKAASITSILRSRKFAVLAISLISTAVLIAYGVFAYKSNKYNQAYAENYFKALYCLKTGVDTNVKACAKLKAEWETASAAGRSFSPGIRINDDGKSVKLRSEIDKYMQKTSNPSNKLLQASESLNKIYKIYLDSEALIQSKPGSLQELGNSVDTLNKNMSQASQDMKSTLPELLQQEFTVAKSKYRGLNDF